MRKDDYTYADDYIETVTRITKTQIVVGKMRFQRDTGREIGSQSGWFRQSIDILTPADEVRIRHRTLAKQLASIGIEKTIKLPLDKLEKAAELLFGVSP